MKTRRKKMNYDNVTIEGFVTHDPSVKKTKTGKDVCNFSIAINHYTRADSEPQVSYIDVETWEKLARVCSDNITRGKRVMVIGALKQDRWEGKDGKPQSKIKIVCRDIRFLESLKANKENEKEGSEKQAEVA
jgi:single-strand DNA-binding protein